MSLIPCKISGSWGQRFSSQPPPPLVKGVGTKRLGKGRVEGLKFRSINVKIHVVDLHVLFLEFLITQRLFIKWDKIWILKVEKIENLLTMATFLE